MRNLIGVIMICLCLVSGKSWAGEEKNIATMVNLNTDFDNPEKGDSYTKYGMFTYWHKDWLGGGVDITVNPKSEKTTVKPIVTINNGPYYLIAGLSTTSSGNDYFQAGVWYINSFGKLNICLDVRNYFDIKDGGTDFADNYFEATYGLSENISAGLVVIYDHWWASDNDFLKIGPIAYYKINENAKVYIRATTESFWSDAGKSDASEIRLGVKFFF